MAACLAGTIVHPKATIFAIAGPIIIVAGCSIEEAAIIVNRCAFRLQLRSTRMTDISNFRRKEVMRIGDDNLFEIQCRTCITP